MKGPTAALGLVASLLLCARPVEAAGQGDPALLTDIDDVVMYGVDNLTYELLRFDFGADEYTRIGVVKDAADVVVTQVDGLAMIPHGPARGLYATTNAVSPSRLVKISPLGAQATVAGDPIGWDGVEGLVAYLDPATATWRLLGVARDPVTALIEIDPATGAGTLLMETSRRYEGLAIDPQGIIYGTSTLGELWEIDLEAASEKRMGDLAGYGAVGALEYAFGDFEERIKVPLSGGEVVPDAWTMAGILFGFTADQSALLIINARTGQTVEWPCTFNVDCQGLVFTTRLRDPFGPILASACD